VVGYQRERIAEALVPAFPQVHLIDNTRYTEDRNILSLLCGIAGRDDPALIIEGDVVFDETSIGMLSNISAGTRSVWTTCGYFQPWQVGGILRSLEGGRISEIRYVNRYDAAYAEYKKILGAIFVGPKEMPVYRKLLETAAKKSIEQYFMIPWAENLSQLPCWEGDLSSGLNGSFNTPEEYARCVELFTASTMTGQGKP
jgi:hypothetical protein